MKRTGTLSLLWIAAIMIPLTASAELSIVKEGASKNSKGYVSDMYGVLDSETGEFVIKPEYESLQAGFSDTYIAKLHGRMGIIDSSGNVVVDFKYDQITLQIRNYVIGIKYNHPRRHRLYDGRKFQAQYEYQFGIMNRKGDVVVPIQYETIQETDVPNVYRVTEGEGSAGRTYGLVGPGGDVILPVEYDKIRNIKMSGKNKLSVTAYKGRKQETMEIDVKFPDAEKESAAAVVKFKEGEKYGYKCGAGVLVPPIYEDAWDFKNGYARVKRKGKWGLINEKGETALELKYDYVWDCVEGRAKVRLEDGSTELDELRSIPSTKTDDEE